MRPRRLLATLVIVLFFASALRSQGGPEFFPISEIRPGLKGVGRTVFEGDKVEEFQVEILGVVKNAIAPKHDIILARLSGGPLDKAGVIAGMSGSPVYVDGKLVGAVALSFPFSKEPLTGITPIEEMLRVVPEGTLPPPTHVATNLGFRIARTSTDPVGRLIPEDNAELPPLNRCIPAPAGAGSPFGLRLPLRFAGFASEAVQAYAPLLREMGFEPIQGGALSGPDSSAPFKTDMAPGSMISLLLVQGDLSLSIDCTVTYRRGDQIYACGHRALLAGPTEIPFAPARVVAVVPSLASSFKVDAPGPLVGTIRQDRFSAIYGVVGTKARLIPVRVHIDTTLNKQEDYRFEMVQDPFLSPLLLSLALPSTLSATERGMGPSTLEFKGKILLSGGESVEVEDVVSGDIGMANIAASAISTPLTYLLGSGFPNLRVEGIDLSIVSRNEKRVATLEQVWSTKSEVRPGDHIEVTALSRTPWGEPVIQKIPVDIPESVTDKMLSLVVGSGASINALQFRVSPLSTTPRDLQQIVRALNRMRRNNRLYALLMAPQRSFFLQGEEYPSPPPSLVQTFLADPGIASSVTLSSTSVVGDFETKPSPYFIRGQKTLLLKVVSTGT